MTVAGPDLQIRGDGGGGGHADPEIKRGPGLNFFFRPFLAQFGLKLSGGGPPLAPPVDPASALSEPYFYSKINVNVIDVVPNVSVVSFVAISTLLLL